MRTTSKYLSPDILESLFEEEGLLCISDWNDGSLDKDDNNDLGTF